MRSRQAVPPSLIRLAQQQSGVVSRAQACGLGLSVTVIRRLVADERWGRLEAGIFMVPAVPPSWTSRVWAGVLMGGAHARAGGLTAAVLHGLADDEHLPIEILVPYGVRLLNRDWVRFRQERDRVRAASTRAEPPRTRIEDTVLDLCARTSESGSVDWVTKAVQRRLTTPEALSAALGRRSRMPNRKLITDLLGDVASGVHSVLEHRYLHEVERAHSLATGSRQRSRPSRNEFIDVVYDEYSLVVELDGRIGHVGRLRDRRRDNVHTRKGSPSLRFGWHEVTEDPCGVAAEVAEVLLAQGWPGYPGAMPPLPVSCGGHHSG